MVDNPSVIPIRMTAAASKEAKPEFTNPVYEYVPERKEEEKDCPSRLSFAHSFPYKHVALAINLLHKTST